MESKEYKIKLEQLKIASLPWETKMFKMLFFQTEILIQLLERFE